VTLRAFGQLVAAAIAVVGALLLAFPKMDQPWLDALEAVAPPVQTVFLTEFERATRTDALKDIDRAQAELARLRALEQDVRWGRAQMDPEKAERLRQYLAGRGEIAAGDQLVLQSLRAKARERQRWMLGLPLLLIGTVGFAWLAARRA
jgi:zinc/manganese transport system permease protein